jgi:hypothetical protein
MTIGALPSRTSSQQYTVCLHDDSTARRTAGLAVAEPLPRRRHDEYSLGTGGRQVWHPHVWAAEDRPQSTDSDATGRSAGRPPSVSPEADRTAAIARTGLCRP